MAKRIVACIMFACWYFAAFSQTGKAGTELIKLTRHSDSVVNQYPAEKLYIQFDKTAYTTGDTIWLKAYLFNTVSHFLSSRSGLLHIDIANDSNRIVKQYLLQVNKGLSWGNIALGEADFKPGDYTIRAYTAWMRNFGESGFYYKSIRIAGAGENGWLIRSNISTGNNSLIRAELQLTGMDKTTMADSTLQAEVISGKKVLYRQTVQTDHHGLIDVDFTLPPKTSAPVIVLQNKSKTKRAVIPLIRNNPESTDVQFMPEGGSLVGGLPAHIGFKAIGEDGRGVDISGIIIDHNDSTVATFKALHNGIGSFYISPNIGEIYKAKVTLKGNIVKEYALPVVKPSGTLLQARDLPNNDSLEVIVAATDDIIKNGAGYFLVGKARGIVCYAAVVDFNKQQFIRSKIAKKLFPSGIAHFSLMTSQGQPLNERLVYIDHRDDLRIDIEPDRQTYAPKDSVALHIKVTDNANRPVPGNFSLAVTDDAQVKADSLNDDNILTRSLLTSDLKGYVEEPGYYFEDTQAAKHALDNLLLTQGWMNYEPANGTMPFEAETDYKIQGRANNVFNKGLKKTDIVLLSIKPPIVMDTVTNKEGRFVFDHFPRVDTPIFVIKTNNRNFNVNIDMDEPVLPIFEPPAFPLITPWYVNTDSTLMNYVNSDSKMKNLEYYPGTGRVLKEVKITAKKTVKESDNLNGAGNADVVLDEKDLESANKKTFRQLFEQNIKGFKEVYHGGHPWYCIYNKPIILIVDGVRVDQLYTTFDLKQYIEYHNAEDIKGMEVMSLDKYTVSYMARFFPDMPIGRFAFIEITTRTGGPIIKNTPGIFLYKPLALSWPKQFYKPRYTVNDTSKKIDLRSTIDWEPNIATDSAGKEVVSFYTATEPSTYSIILEGTDLNGNVGYKRISIYIGHRREPTKSK